MNKSTLFAGILALLLLLLAVYVFYPEAEAPEIPIQENYSRIDLLDDEAIAPKNNRASIKKEKAPKSFVRNITRRPMPKAWAPKDTKVSELAIIITPKDNFGEALYMAEGGETIYLRGGIYRQAINLKNFAGSPDKPITIRSYPGELAIIDPGYPEFFDRPEDCWEPVPVMDGGASGEYRTKKGYFLGKYASVYMADTMIPLHKYSGIKDLRAKSEFWKGDSRNRDPVYSGPGYWHDWHKSQNTGRIHIRLAHTRLKGLGSRHYRGETDPRKLRLVVSGKSIPMQLTKLKHLRFQDLVIRGARRVAIKMIDCEDVTFDHVHVYAALFGMEVINTKDFKLFHSSIRGFSAPWYWRSTHKYLGKGGYLINVVASSAELAHNEITDHHDGFLFRNMKSLDLHHNFIDNFNDDGIELPSEGNMNVRIYENYISRSFLTFTLHTGVKATGAVHIYRNIVDLRSRVFAYMPKGPGEPELGQFPRLVGDHKSPIWPPYHFYHNTIIRPDASFRDYYGFGAGGRGTVGTKRRVFNNIFLQLKGSPGFAFQQKDKNNKRGVITTDTKVDGNLMWNASDKAKGKVFPEGWENVAPLDRYADPEFIQVTIKEFGELFYHDDLRLQHSSPAIDAGKELPKDWPDSLRFKDEGKPDIGAFPYGANPLSVGVDARLKFPHILKRTTNTVNQ